MPKLKCSSSVKQFEEKALRVWKMEKWGGIDDPVDELVFFGLFHDRDFEVFHNYKGKKNVFWCGGDILRVNEDYERRRIIKLDPTVKHFCENETQAKNLRSAGVEPNIIPSFLGDLKDYPVSFVPPKEGKKWKIWMGGHNRREVEYGFDQARELAKLFPDVEFHFYGVDKEYEGKARIESDNLPNIIYHGLVPEKQLDREIRDYHAGLRCNEHDGLSEVVVKSILLGQYTISRLPYEGVWNYRNFAELIDLIELLKQQIDPSKARNLWVDRLKNFGCYFQLRL